MQAVADSNLAQDGDAVGHRGRARRQARKQPPDYERRIVVMQAYLSHDDSRILADAPDGGPRAATRCRSEIRRSACTWTVPFTVIQLADGTWIVNSGRSHAPPAIRREAASLERQDTAAGKQPVIAGTFHPASLLSYSVSSSRMPAVAFGWTKAIRRPPAPVRGISSIRR